MSAAVKNLIFVVDFVGATGQTGISTVSDGVINALPFSWQVFAIARVIQNGAEATATRKRLVFALHGIDLLNHLVVLHFPLCNRFNLVCDLLSNRSAVSDGNLCIGLMVAEEHPSGYTGHGQNFDSRHSYHSLLNQEGIGLA